jgi:hypothetical protein
MPPESGDDRLVLDRKHRRLGFFRAGREIGGGRAFLPLRDVFWLIP